MKTISPGDRGPAVEDIQNRLVLAGHLVPEAVNSVYGETTARAVAAFCEACGLPVSEEVNEKVWAALVDASYNLGDRTLYLKMPYFHGHDVLELQQALGALGFFSGVEDAIFGAHTELALRKFQMNLGLPSDGIAGAYTFAALRNLHHSWEGKAGMHMSGDLGYARAADVLESHALCLFGTDEFTCSVASRMSNLALATNPASKIVSADALSVTPDDDMLLVRVMVGQPDGASTTPAVDVTAGGRLPLRLRAAMDAARQSHPPRLSLVLPGETWEDAGFDRSAQHYAIQLLDALCQALSE